MSWPAMNVKSVRPMNDSADAVPAGTVEPATEPPHSWLAALRARLLQGSLEYGTRGSGPRVAGGCVHPSLSARL